MTTRRPVYKRWWMYPLLLVVIGALAGGSLLAGILINERRLDNPQPADVIIVLGAQVDVDGLPKPMLERRLDRAYGLFEEGYAPAIIVTGARGDDEPITEASAMKRYLMDKGIGEASIHCEDESYSTWENLANAKSIMEEHNYHTALVVTSEYHLWRALSLCNDLGIEASGAGSLGALGLPQAIRNHVLEILSWVKYLVTR